MLTHMIPLWAVLVLFFSLLTVSVLSNAMLAGQLQAAKQAARAAIREAADLRRASADKGPSAAPEGRGIRIEPGESAEIRLSFEIPISPSGAPTMTVHRSHSVEVVHTSTRSGPKPPGKPS